MLRHPARPHRSCSSRLPRDRPCIVLANVGSSSFTSCTTKSSPVCSTTALHERLAISHTRCNYNRFTAGTDATPRITLHAGTRRCNCHPTPTRHLTAPPAAVWPTTSLPTATNTREPQTPPTDAQPNRSRATWLQGQRTQPAKQRHLSARATTTSTSDTPNSVVLCNDADARQMTIGSSERARERERETERGKERKR